MSIKAEGSAWVTAELVRSKNNKEISCYLGILAEVSAPIPSDADLAQKNSDTAMRPTHKNVY